MHVHHKKEVMFFSENLASHVRAFSAMMPMLLAEGVLLYGEEICK